MSIFANPMILMIVLMGGMSLCLPKLMASVDQDALNEARGIKTKKGDADDDGGDAAASSGPQPAQILSPNVFGSGQQVAAKKTIEKKSPSSTSSKQSSSSNNAAASSKQQQTSSKDIMEMD